MAESTFFNNLKKLFSQTAIVTVNKDGKRTVADIDHMQQTNLSSLRDRYSKLQTSFHEQAGSIQSMAYQQVRREVFRDFDAMDNDPIIASALDIYADECLAGDTLIPLLDGTKRTIKDLYESRDTDIWLYGLDESDNTFTPVKADKVAYNGKKQLYEVTFDDGTQIKCTSNHIWIDSNGNQIFTDDLDIGQSILALPTKISDSTHMNGYEMIHNGKSYEFVHRIVGNSVPVLIEEKRELPDDVTKILHHTSFDKRNNNPNDLKWLDWVTHNQVHSKFNKELWNNINSNVELKSNYYDKLITGQQKFWNSELSDDRRLQHSDFMKEYMNSLSSDERKSKYGSVGSDNGMYKNGHRITGNNNGRYDVSSNRIEYVDIDYIKSEIRKNPRINILNKLRTELNFNTYEWSKLIKQLFREYNISHNSKVLINKILAENYDLISKFRQYCKNTYVIGKRFTIGDFCSKMNINKSILRRTIIASGYSGVTEFAESTNHKVLSIKKVGIEDTYDIVNAGDNHIYALEANDGSKLYTHNSTLKDEFGDVMTIRSDNEEVQELLENLFYDILNVEFNLWPWVRNMCKYGDFFLGLEMAEGKGILNVTPHSVYNTERLEPVDPRTPNAVRFKVEMDPNIKNEYDNYEMAHFRLLSDTNWLPYGKAMIENGRRLWKQLSLMEDAMLIHRIMRAPEKRVFKVDIGNIKPTEVDNYMQKIINKMKKVPFLDKTNGDYNLKYNMQNLTEDFYLPVRGSDSGTSIENIGGLEYTAIEDIDYLKNKLFAALKIPRAYLGYEENVNGKATLAAEDVRFARTIERIQRTVISELTKIAIIHLYSCGITDSRLTNFSIKLVNPSTIYEQERLELWAEKVRLAGDIKDLNMLSKDWVYEKIFNMGDDEQKIERGRIIKDVQDRYRHAQIEEDGNDPAKQDDPTDVEESLETLKNEFKDKGGRPSESGKYGKDKSPYGRDPLGNKEREGALSNRTSEHVVTQYTKNIPRKKTTINEDKGMLSDSNILDDDEI